MCAVVCVRACASMCVCVCVCAGVFVIVCVCVCVVNVGDLPKEGMADRSSRSVSMCGV